MGPKVRIRATETSRFSAGETGNLYAQQYQIGQPEATRFAVLTILVVPQGELAGR